MIRTISLNPSQTKISGYNSGDTVFAGTVNATTVNLTNLNFGAAVICTLATNGLATATATNLNITPYGAASADTLTELGYSKTDIVIVKIPESKSLFIPDNSNFYLGADRVLDHRSDRLVLQYEPSLGAWCEVSFTDNE